MHCNDMLKDPSTYLCFKCQKLILNHDILEENLATLSSEIDAKFEALFSGVYAFSDNINDHTETVTKQPSNITDLPYPVGKATKVSLPDTKVSKASVCFDFSSLTNTNAPHCFL